MKKYLMCSLSLLFLFSSINIVNAERLYSATVPYFSNGFTFNTGTVSRDPSMLVVVFGQTGDVARVLKNAIGNYPEFDPHANINVHFEFDGNQSSIVMEQAMTYLVVQDTFLGELSFESIKELPFQAIERGASLAIDPADIIIFKTPAFVDSLYAMQVTFDESGGITPLSIDVRAVPEPGTVLLFGLGLFGLVALIRRRKTSKVISSLFSIVILSALLSFTSEGNAQVAVDCSSPTIQTIASGNWNNVNIWNEGRLPGTDDIVMIHPEHEVTGNVPTILIKALCNDGILWSPEQADVWLAATDFIANGRGILGRDGATYNDNHINPSPPGRNIVLQTQTFYNAGVVQAGRGGASIQWWGSRGGKGGNLEIYADTISNEGFIGPDCGSAELDGGTGGRAYSFRRRYCEARGGNGGNTVVFANSMAINSSTGQIASGKGGDAGVNDSGRTWPGKGGNVTFSAPITVQEGTLKTCGKGESFIIWDPEMIMRGDAARLDAGNILIYGGEDWTLNLSDLPSGALKAENTITLMVGTGASVDLRGAASGAISAQKLEIFADADRIMLDEGKELSDIIINPNKKCYRVCSIGGFPFGCLKWTTVCEEQKAAISIRPAKILYDAFLSAPSAVKGGGGKTLRVELLLANNSPADDSYSLTATGSRGWHLQLPQSLDVATLQTSNVPLDIRIPTRPGEVNVITIRASSQSDPNVVRTRQIVVAAEATFFTVRKGGEGSGTILAGNTTCGISCPQVTVPYKDRTAMPLKAIPADDSRFVRWERVDGGAVLSEPYEAAPDETIVAIFEKK